MTVQPNLFAGSHISAPPDMPAGFRYRPELINPDEEAALATEIASLPLQPFAFQKYLANRRVTAFGFHYDYSRREVVAAAALPPFLLDLRDKVAGFAGHAPEDFRQVLVTEYAPGAGIGWHRDRPQYGEIVGVSLLSPANFRLRRREGDRWVRAARVIERRSAYMMAGEVRQSWEHSIPEADALRYSLTFRTLASDLTSPGSGSTPSLRTPVRRPPGGG